MIPEWVIGGGGLVGAVMLIVTGVLAWRKFRVDEQKVLTDTALGMVKQMKEDLAAVKAENKEQAATIVEMDQRFKATVATMEERIARLEDEKAEQYEHVIQLCQQVRNFGETPVIHKVKRRRDVDAE